MREYLSGLPLRDRAAAADVLDAIREHGLQALESDSNRFEKNFGNFMLKLGPPIVSFMSP